MRKSIRLEVNLKYTGCLNKYLGLIGHFEKSSELSLRKQKSLHLLLPPNKIK